jgi:diguanylate cyclase (GGDEF)-like protein/PAS domain S-box-containing protein
VRRDMSQDTHNLSSEFCFAAFPRAAQYLAGLLPGADLFEETVRVERRIFQAEFACVFLRPDLDTPARLDAPEATLAALLAACRAKREVIAQVLDTGFLAEEEDAALGGCFLFLPISRGGDVFAVLGVLFRAHAPLPRPALEAQLALAGLVGAAFDRQQAIAALRDSEEKFRQISANAQDAIVMLDDQGLVVYWNAAAQRIFGFGADEVLGRDLHRLIIEPALYPAFAAGFQAFQASGTGPVVGHLVPVTGLRKGGEAFPGELTVSATLFGGRRYAIGIVRDTTERQRAEAALHELDRKNALILDSVAEGIYGIDAEGVTTFINPAAARMLGYPAEELLGHRLHELIHHHYPDGTPYAEADCRLLASIHAGVTLTGEDEWLWRKDGSGFAIAYTSTPIRTGQAIVGAVVTFLDISARIKAQEGERLAAQVFASSHEAIAITDARGTIVAVNEAFTRITGYPAEEAIGQNPRLLKSGRQSDDFYRAMWAELAEQGHWRGEIWNRRRDGQIYPAWLSITRVADAAGRASHYIGIATDITVHKLAEERIRYLAYYDALTELPNRALLEDRAHKAMAMATREGRSLAMLFLDLDHFKHINDTLGHPVGDQLLREVASRLLTIVRESDTVCRLGGDEFVVMIAGHGLEGVRRVAEEIMAAIARPSRIEGHQLNITPSIGISLYPEDANDFDTLLKHADMAMYRAKEGGRNGYQFFTEEMNVTVFERMLMENGLRKALDLHEFVLHYQPQVDLASGRVVGVESLIRWQHPELGLVPPGRFIPVAEESGLIEPIGNWVLDEACRQARAWQDLGLPTMRVAVNLSGRQFRNQALEANIAQAIARSGLAPEWLELELTESVVMENSATTIEILGRLSAMGLQIAVDDFGTGYSSLSYLKRFPIHRLKIDQSFVRDIATDPDDHAIAHAIIQMGHSLRLTVIAEGVETSEHLEMLRSLGCDVAQGYLISRPVPAQAMTEFLRQASRP